MERKKPSQILREQRLKTLGGRIEEILRINHLRPVDLARKLEVKRQAVSGWIHNQSIPNFKHLGQIALLREGINVRWFFIGEGRPYELTAAGDEWEKRELYLLRKLHEKEEEIRNLKSNNVTE